MKVVRLLSLAAASLVVFASTRATTMDDVQFWVGSGPNRAALVIDWNDGKSAESLLWGYRWSGSANGLDMLQAVVNADTRLFGHFGVFVFGTSVFGIGYDLNSNGVFGVSPALSFDGGGLIVDAGDANANDARAAAESGDHYFEGWNSGFWGYNLKASDNEVWSSAFFGPADRPLTDGSWDGYSFAPGFNFTDPSAPIAAVPEPTTVVLFSVAALFLSCARRKS